MERGAIPATGRITLESVPDQWQLVNSGMIKEFSTTAVIYLDREEKKVRVQIVLTKVITPGDFIFITQSQPVVIAESIAEYADAVTEAKQFFCNERDLSTWILVGYISGQKKVPFIILYYAKFNFAVYSVIKNDTDMQKYFPMGLEAASAN